MSLTTNDLTFSRHIAIAHSFSSDLYNYLSHMSTAPRIPWIDECKGFVLLLVCLFHIEQSFANIQIGMLNFSAFRMSSFFFISGLLFSNRKFTSFKDYAKHKTKVLLKPYILLSLLFLALDPVLYNFSVYYPRAPKMMILGIVPDIQNVWQYIKWNVIKIFFAGKSSIGSGPIWFVFNLFCISLLFYITHKVTNRNRWAIALFALAALIGGWTLNRYHIHLPWGIERILTTFAFFAGGYLSKLGVQKLDKRNVFVLLGIVGLSAGLYWIINAPNPNFSVMNNSLGKNFGIFFGSSLFGILGLITLFQLLNHLPQNIVINTAKGILRNISRNGMIILAVHWWILLILRIVFKSELDHPKIAYISIGIVTLGVILSIPLFRNKLYHLIAKEKISVRESLSIQ